MGLMFKVTGPQGSAPNGGKMFWDLPKNGKPGRWHEIKKGETVRACATGFHLTNRPSNWGAGDKNKEVWIAEGDGDRETEGDKTAFAKARLIEKADINSIAQNLGIDINVMDGSPDVDLMDSGDGYGDGSGSGYGDGSGSGYGYGYGDGSGSGSGSGSGYGYGYGYGSGDGSGYGYGDGYGYGYGYGDGSGSGYGYGYGDGSGSGSGSGSGYGYGYGSGDGYGYGSGDGYGYPKA